MDENKWQFFTAPMYEYLPGLDTTDSSWGTNWVYYYWFEKYENKLIIHFELGGWNLTDELTKRTNALIEASKKKVDEYRYKRLYYKSTKLSQDDYEARNRCLPPVALMLYHTGGQALKLPPLLNDEEKLVNVIQKIIDTWKGNLGCSSIKNKIL